MKYTTYIPNYQKSIYSNENQKFSPLTSVAMGSPKRNPQMQLNNVIVVSQDFRT